MKNKNILIENKKNSSKEEVYKSENDEVKKLKSDVELLEQRLASAKRDLLKQERFSAIGELSSRVSHDIRNPLSVIQSTVILWKQIHKDIDKEDLKKLDMIDRAASKIKYLTENLLDFVRSQEPQYQDVSVLEMIEDSVKSISGSKNIKFFFPKNDLIIRCDPRQMEIVLKNLMTNSVQAIGDQPGSIILDSRQEHNSILISIQDSGEGIPEKIASKIFDPLFTTKKEGTGLGLVSCKSIIASHKGTLTFFCNPTTFLITLPKLP